MERRKIMIRNEIRKQIKHDIEKSRIKIAMLTGR